MNFKNKLFVCIFFIVTLFSCSSQRENIFLLTIELKNSQNLSQKYSYLYGFWGDNQILVDSIQIVDSKMEYEISKTCNAGVYRLVFPNKKYLDFIYNNEQISFSFDVNDILKTISIIQSEENKRFYSYINDLETIKSTLKIEKQKKLQVDNSDTIEIEKQLQKKFTQLYVKIYTENLQKISNSNSLVYSIIKSMNLLDYDQFMSVHPDSKISKSEFYNDIYFKNYSIEDSRLLATPYLYTIIQNYLIFIKDVDTEKLSDAFTALFGITKQKDIQVFITNYSYEYL